MLWKELIEAPEREHSREYHVAVWAQHTADALGDPSTLDVFQDPDLTPNSLAQGLIFALRLLLDEDPRRVRRICTAVESALRDARLRRAQGHDSVAHQDAELAPEREAIPEDIAVGLRRLTSHSDNAGGDLWTCLAVEQAAAQVSRLSEYAVPAT
ncbi:hypothetical protein [Streptomyces xiamenensis]|uniref:hypothetical protein n=1 Tax=Streptomyces xiamenensis TaxID=408015 RepID=UPI0035D99068